MGSNVCQHKKIRTKCKDCTPANFCEHGRYISKCKLLGEKRINDGLKPGVLHNTIECKFFINIYYNCFYE
jgi:hypothetical protein